MEHNLTPEQLAQGEEAPRKSHQAMAALWSQLRAQSQSEDHLFYEQLEAYVDDELDEADSRAVQSHLAGCSQCESRAQNLSVLRQELLRQDKSSVITEVPVIRTTPQPAVRVGQSQEIKAKTAPQDAVVEPRAAKSKSQN